MQTPFDPLSAHSEDVKGYITQMAYFGLFGFPHELENVDIVQLQVLCTFESCTGFLRWVNTYIVQDQVLQLTDFVASREKYLIVFETALLLS